MVVALVLLSSFSQHMEEDIEYERLTCSREEKASLANQALSLIPNATLCTYQNLGTRLNVFFPALFDLPMYDVISFFTPFIGGSQVTIRSHSFQVNPQTV